MNFINKNIFFCSSRFKSITEFRFYIGMSKLKLLNFDTLYDLIYVVLWIFLVFQCFTLKSLIKSSVSLPIKRRRIKFWLTLEKSMTYINLMLPISIQKMFVKWTILSKEGKIPLILDINAKKLRLYRLIGIKDNVDYSFGLLFAFYFWKKFLLLIL